MLSPRASEGFHLAISQTLFLGLVWGSTWVSFIFVLFRVYSRLKTFRRLFFDDALVLFAWVILLITAAIWQKRVYIIYYVTDIGNGVIYPPPPDLWELRDKQVHQGLAVTILNFLSLWSVKFAFLVLFRKMGRNVRGQKLLWWFVFLFTVATLAVSIGIQAYGCVFGDIKIIAAKCGQPAEGRYIRAILRVQAAVDIVSDCFITTIPITLLWVVRLNVRLKLEASAVFCLTLFTMIAAVVRVVMSLQGKREDDSWLFSWSAVESAVAIIISCLVAYRVSSKREPVKKRYYGHTSAYRLKDMSRSSSTNVYQREIGRGDEPSSTRIADEEILPLPQAVYLGNDSVLHQSSI